ncbi:MULTISPECIES: hypothetical protein [Fusobacterium]|jgi:hypothetical protein|uniref:hypothetical protein n=1 Tax=Fusobacterium TaxID=848 RepID=UPI0001B8F32E|nr:MULTISPECIES: hypothetical protein [Fusobacterium]EEW95979.1 hypothetical protein HMPREF0406_00419 [Fusobacterium animalis 3_1_33]MCL4585938.1 hypothetical protein [Fusobacterium nucleatum YWH7055]
MRTIFRCLLESAVYTILVLLIFYFLPYTKKEFLILNLHPLEIVVALMSLRYGTYLGILSSFIAISGYIFAYLHSGNDMILFLLKFQYYKFFLMFLFTAMILGKFKLNYKNREEDLKKGFEHLENSFQEEKEKNQQLLDINISLKNQIIRSGGSIVSFHNLKRELLQIKKEESYEKILEIFRQLLACEVCSMYTLADNKLTRRFEIGKSKMEREILLDTKEGERFLEVSKKSTSLNFPFDITGKQPIFIGPLYNEKNIMGFLEIENFSYTTGEKYNFELFKILMEEINEILQKRGD